jgi:hypothetical protein
VIPRGVAIGLGGSGNRPGQCQDPWKYLGVSSPIENSIKSSGQNHSLSLPCLKEDKRVTPFVITKRDTVTPVLWQKDLVKAAENADTGIRTKG